MYRKVTTLTEFLIQEEHQFEDATGSFTLLLTTIENAIKIIASHVRRSGLADILGNADSVNSSGDDVVKLDVLSNEIFLDSLLNSGQVFAAASEEMEEPVLSKYSDAHYVVFFDPLDGSKNIDVNCNVGTIFSVYRKSGKGQDAGSMLQPGSKLIAAGYVLYGPSVTFVYSCGHGVHEFTLDPAVGSFLLSRRDMRIPDKGKDYCINESYFDLYEPGVQEFLKKMHMDGRALRWSAAMVGDVNRILLQGGIFAYPGRANKPNGHLRLMYEVNPMSYLITQAGGAAFSGEDQVSEVVPTELHQKVPVVMGSKGDVELFQKMSVGK